MTAHFTATRSPTRQLLMAAAGLLLLLAALDIVSLHKLSDAPNTDDEGNLTTKGQTERNTDFVWGGLFTAVGGTLIVVGLGGLMTARPMVELTDESMRLRVAGPLSMLDVAWDDVVSVRSGRDYGDDGHIPMSVLRVEISDPTKYPDALWGAEWRGNVLEVDADGWEAPVEDIVIRAELMLGGPEEGDEQ